MLPFLAREHIGALWLKMVAKTKAYEKTMGLCLVTKQRKGKIKRMWRSCKYNHFNPFGLLRTIFTPGFATRGAERLLSLRVKIEDFVGEASRSPKRKRSLSSSTAGGKNDPLYKHL